MGFNTFSIRSRAFASTSALIEADTEALFFAGWIFHGSLGFGIFVRPSFLVPIEPAGGGRPYVPNRTNGTGRDQDLLADLGVADPPGDLELHVALQHEDQFVGRMREVLSAPSR